jgi:hypothetical protein
MGQVGKSLLDASWLMGFRNLTDAISEPDKYLDTFLSNIVLQAVPASGLLRNITNVTDNNVKDTRRYADTTLTQPVVEQVKSAIPGLSKTVPSRLDVFGQEVKKSGKEGWKALLPVNPTQANGDPVVKELDRLEIPVGFAQKTLSKKVDGERVKRKLTRAEYLDYQKAVGQAIRDNISKVIARPEYADKSDKWKKTRIEKAISNARSDVGTPIREKLLPGSTPRKGRSLTGRPSPKRHGRS